MKKTLLLPSTSQVSFAIGKITFSEILRDRVLYNVILCSLCLIMISFFASELMILHPARIVLDFGLAAVSISSGMIGIFTGASLITKEIERRTIYVALCHPISRLQFVIGKFIGLASIIIINALLLIALFLTFLIIIPGGKESLSLTLTIALCFIVLQSLLLGSLSLFFSSFTTTSLAIICSIGFFLIGNNISHILFFAEKSNHTWVKQGAMLLQATLPHFEYFNITTKVTYQLPVSALYFFSATAYAFLMTSLLLLLSSIVLNRREL